MKVLHVKVEQDDGWFIAQGLEEPGVITQGRTLDELVFMIRDAVDLMFNEKDVQIELLLPSDAITSFKKRRLTKRKPSRTRRAAKAA